MLCFNTRSVDGKRVERFGLLISRFRVNWFRVSGLTCTGLLGLG